MEILDKVFEYAGIKCLDITQRIINVKTLLRAFHLAEVANDSTKVYVVLPNSANDIIFKKAGNAYALLIWCDRWIWLDAPICAKTTECAIRTYLKTIISCHTCSGSMLPMLWCTHCFIPTCIRCHGVLVVPEPEVVNLCAHCSFPLEKAMVHTFLRCHDDTINMFTEFKRIQKRQSQLFMV